VTFDGWAEAHRLFEEWPDPRPAQGAGGASRRLGDALLELREGKAGWRDVAALARQVLLEAQARNNGSPLVVPIDLLLPSAQQWHEARCQVQPTGSRLNVWARQWSPSAPEGPAALAAEADLRQVYLGQDSPQRRLLDNCPADPFWAVSLRHGHYLSIGQRQAARTVALAPPGSTTIVCLPTGHGKTDVVLAAALLARSDRGICLVMVPTVMLAIDIERRVRGVLEAAGIESPSGRYAYAGDMPEDNKRQVIRDVRSGRQRVLIAAPEAVAQSLLRPLGEAAEAGFLTHFVIDEAHLVEQWGNDFRPSFQTIASQRHAWIRKAPPGRAPRTVAMSATLTALQVETLELLFGAPGPTEIVWASQLRSEPSYYVEFFPAESSRQEAVIEAVTLLPRPLALYVSKREDAKEWASRLRTSGLQRVAAVTGESSAGERRAALEGWSARSADGLAAPSRLDVLVGTSALGLGVDLPDVKTVVHACVPETVDRYYQEVGRGGRDGSPCLSYLATAPADMSVAEDLNAQAIITPERAWERWRAMFQSRQSGSGPVYHVELDARPADLATGFGRSRLWNIRVLNLMARARLIEVHVPEMPSRDGDPDEVWQVRLAAFYASVAAWADISLSDGRTNDSGHFQAVLASARNDILNGQRTALARLRAALRGDQCISDVLAGYYVVQRPDGPLLTSPWCRGCPHCRRGGPPDGFCRVGWEPHPTVAAWPRDSHDPLATFRGPGQSCVSIWWDTEQERRDLVPELVARLCRAGMPVIGGPGMDETAAAWIQKEARPHPVILDGDENLLVTYTGPVVWILGADTTMDAQVVGRIETSDVTYLLHPRRLAHPGKPGALLADIHRPSFSIRTARRAL
jgi:ATP-dependent DNA helicase RecQ